MRTPLQVHIDRWRKGCGSIICPGSREKSLCADVVVLGKGDIPCDVLFVGEAPGDSENIYGQPFKGPAGILLDRLIERAIGDWDPRPRLAFTNLVGCFPKEQKADKTNAPPVEVIVGCRQRLVEFIEIARPKLIICVGVLAKKYMIVPRGFRCRFAEILHPAAILKNTARMVASRGMAEQGIVAGIATAVEELYQSLSLTS